MLPTLTSTKTVSTSGPALRTRQSMRLPNGKGLTNGISPSVAINGKQTTTHSVFGTEMANNNNNVVNGSNGVKSVAGRKSSLHHDSNQLAADGSIAGAEPLVVVGRNVVIFALFHAIAVYGFYLFFSFQIKLSTFLFAVSYYIMSGWGITGGAHRYWGHKSFKAKTPLRLFLAFTQTLAVQNSIHEWVRDHRVHHKFTETNADPHDARRGFFFSHMGWLLCRKHSEVKRKGKLIDMSDMEADPIVMFQKKYYGLLALTISFVIPIAFPIIYSGESYWTASCVAIARYIITLHMTWLVNSAAHKWGSRPYDKTINPAENKYVSFLAFGEGWHNYHHVFPWDYKTAEIGIYHYNFTAAFIDFMALIGQAYDLKTVPSEIVQQRVARTGDGSHDHHSEFNPGPWGWGDKDIPQSDIEVTETLYKKD